MSKEKAAEAQRKILELRQMGYSGPIFIDEQGNITLEREPGGRSDDLSLDS